MPGIKGAAHGVTDERVRCGIIVFTQGTMTAPRFIAGMETLSLPAVFRPDCYLHGGTGRLRSQNPVALGPRGGVNSDVKLLSCLFVIGRLCGC